MANPFRICICIILSLMCLPRPAHAGTIERAGVFGGSFSDMVVQDDHAIIAAGLGGLFIFDISTPDSPVFHQRVELPGELIDLDRRGDILAVAARDGGVHLLDISDGSAPTLLSTIAADGLARAIHFDDNLLLIADANLDNPRLRIFDSTDPLTPTLVGEAEDTPYAMSIATHNGFAYLANGSSINIFDISDPSNPQFVLHDGSTDANDLVIIDGVLFTDRYGLNSHAIDGATLTHLDHLADSASEARLFAVGDVIYMAPLNGGAIYIADASDPHNLALIDVVRLTREENTARDGRSGVQPVGDHLLVAQGGSGLQVADRTLPEPDWIAHVIGSYATAGTVLGFHSQGDTLYLASGVNGLRILHAPNLDDASEIGHIDTEDTANAVHVVNDVAYVACLASLKLYNVADPAIPVYLGKVAEIQTAFEIARYGPHLYVASDEAGTYVLDVSEPDSPNVIGLLEAPGSARSVSVGLSEGRIIAAVGAMDRGAHLFDVTDPRQPEHLFNLTTQGTTSGVSIWQSRLALAEGSRGARVVDISNPQSPSTIQSFGSSSVHPDRRIYLQGPQLITITPTLVHVYETQNSGYTLRGEITLAGPVPSALIDEDRLFVADNAGSIHAVRSSAYSLPARVVARLPAPVNVLAGAITEDGQHLVVGTEQGYVHILDATEAPSAMPVASLRTYSRVEDVLIRGDIALVSCFRGGTHIIDLSDPRSPQRLGINQLRLSTANVGDLVASLDSFIIHLFNMDSALYPVPSSTIAGEWKEVKVEGDRLFVRGRLNGSPDLLRQYDISNPLAPIARGFHQIAASGQGLIVQGPLVAYVRSPAIEFYDFSFDLAPQFLGSHAMFGAMGAADGRHYYITRRASTDGFEILDTSDPASVRSLGEISEELNAEWIHVKDGFLYFAQQHDGIIRFDVRDCKACPGDVNGDASVDIMDLEQLLSQWAANVHPDTSADLTGDGRIDFSDLTLLLDLWGNVCP